MVGIILIGATACVATGGGPATAWLEAWTEPDGPFEVAVLAKDKSGQVPPTRVPKEGGTVKVAGGHWRHAFVYTPGLPIDIEVDAFAGKVSHIIVAKIEDGGNTYTRRGTGTVTLEWQTVQ